MNVHPHDSLPDSSWAHWWQFSALDSWFFRESRPFDSIGGAQLVSYFPPPARTLAGAVRTAVGEAQGVNWQRFNNRDTAYDDLRAQIGDARSYGDFRLYGPYVLQDGQRLFPAPLLLLQKGATIARLKPGEDVIACDLGRVRLPQLTGVLPGAKALENAWLTRAGMEKTLAGGVPDAADVRIAKQLFGSEERLGIARDNRQRANIEGLLYQTRHVRPGPDVTIGVQVSGVKAAPPSGTIRLGGEGRFSSFTVSSQLPTPLALPSAVTNRLLLTLLTPTDFAGDNGKPHWMPPNFVREERNGADVWRGTLKNVSLTIVSAIVGKPVREGGWDLASNQPRALRSLVPAGSCYFCEVEGEARQAAAQLHHQKVGGETELGRGEIAVGVWN